MKNRFLSIALLAGMFTAVTNVTAQTNKAVTASSQQDQTDKADGVYIMNNKPMIMKGGKAEPLQHDIKLANGTVVKSNGVIKRPDGSEAKLKNGDVINMQGQVSKKNK